MLQRLGVLVRGGVVGKQSLYSVLNEVSDFHVFLLAEGCQFALADQLPKFLRAVGFQPIFVLLPVFSAKAAKIGSRGPTCVIAGACFLICNFLIGKEAHATTDFFRDFLKQCQALRLRHGIKLRQQLLLRDIFKPVEPFLFCHSLQGLHADVHKCTSACFV